MVPWLPVPRGVTHSLCADLRRGTAQCGPALTPPPPGVDTQLVLVGSVGDRDEEGHHSEPLPRLP
jgi:hypothetical protein